MTTLRSVPLHHWNEKGIQDLDDFFGLKYPTLCKIICRNYQMKLQFEVLERSARVRSLSFCNSITACDSSTLYTTIPHSKLKDRLKTAVQLSGQSGILPEGSWNDHILSIHDRVPGLKDRTDFRTCWTFSRKVHINHAFVVSFTRKYASLERWFL